MDYKNSISLINEIDRELYEFIESRTDKNIQRGTDIVENYISSLNLNEYSIKSFKAKIIHNELEHRRTSEDFQKVLDDSNLKIENIFDGIFDKYNDVLKKCKSSQTKVSDLREYELSKRRQRQEVINRINNLEKDYQSKKAQDDENYKAKYDEYLQSLQEEARKLTIDINRIKENTIKSYSNEEKELLVRDDKKRINELKESIKEKRIEGLQQEFEQKLKSYAEIRDKKIAFIDVKKEYDILINDDLEEHQIKNAEFKHQIKEIESQIKINSFNYDCNYKIKLYEKMRDAKSILSSIVRVHNDFLYKNENKELTYEQFEKFRISFVLTKLYQIIAFLYEVNLYDPLIDVVERFVEIYKRNNEMYAKTINKIKEKSEQDVNSLKWALESVSLDEKTEKRMTKEELSENVISSIIRYYNNVLNELEMFNEGLQEWLINCIRVISKKYSSISEKNIFAYNDCVFLNTKFNGFELYSLGYTNEAFDSETMLSLNEYYNVLCNKVEEFSNAINNDYQKNIKAMNKQISQYDSKIEDETLKHKSNMEKMNKHYELLKIRFEKNYVKIKKRTIKKYEREYKKNCDRAKRILKQKKRVL